MQALKSPGALPQQQSAADDRSSLNTAFTGGSGTTTTTTTTLVHPAPSFTSPKEDPLASSRFYAYPPSYTIQPNLTTRASQLQSWSKLVQKYCAYHRSFRLMVSDAVNSPLFHNASIGRRLDYVEVMRVLEYMVSGQTVLTSPAKGEAEATIGGGGDNAGGSVGVVDSKHEQRAEWLSAERVGVWIYWRRPEEWAEMIAKWVEETGQKGAVMTLYELVQGEGPTDQDFYGMPNDLLKKVLQVLVKKEKAQIFGSSGEQGVKFF